MFVVKRERKFKVSDGIRLLHEDIFRCSWKVDYPGITAIARQPLSYTSGGIDIQLGARHGNFPWSEHHPPQPFFNVGPFSQTYDSAVDYLEATACQAIPPACCE